MNRRNFLGLLGLIGCKDINENYMNIAKKQWWLSSGSGSSLPEIDLTGITHFVFLGDSIMYGNNATSGNSYRELLTTNFATTSGNAAVGGRGVWQECYQMYSGTYATYTRSVTLLIESAGLNDLRRSNTQQTLNKIESTCKNAIKKHFSTSGNVASGSASVTRSGSFAGYDAVTNGGVYGTGTLPGNYASYNTAASSTWTWSFTGTSCFVVMGASYPSVARGNYEVRIDGSLIETVTDLDDRWDGVSDGSNNNQRGPDVRIYTGLSSGAHSIEVKATSTTAVPVDQFGVLDDPTNLGPLILLEIPYVTDYSKPGLDQASDAVIDQGNAIKQALASQFSALGFPIYYVPIMSSNGGLYNLSNIDSDGVHPTNAGHLQIYNSIQRLFV